LSDRTKLTPKDSSRKLTLHDLFEYERGFYADWAAKKSTGKTTVEVTWLDGGIRLVEVTRKNRGVK